MSLYPFPQLELLLFLQMKTGFAPGSHFLTLRSIEAVKKADRKLMFIPIVFILLRIWGTIRFFRFLVYFPSTPPLQEWLMILHVSAVSIFNIKISNFS